MPTLHLFSRIFFLSLILTAPPPLCDGLVHVGAVLFIIALLPKFQVTFLLQLASALFLNRGISLMTEFPLAVAFSCASSARTSGFLLSFPTTRVSSNLPDPSEGLERTLRIAHAGPPPPNQKKPYKKRKTCDLILSDSSREPLPQEVGGLSLSYR